MRFIMQTPLLDKMVVRPPRTPEELRIVMEKLDELRRQDKESYLPDSTNKTEKK